MQSLLHGQLADANNLLINALKTWTPSRGQSPFTRTQFVLISSARGDTVLPAFQLPRANQIMLYGAFLYQREAGIDYWWKRTSDEHRFEVCFALILLTAAVLDVALIERVLQFLLTLPSHKLLPADVRERLIGLVESSNARISTLALDVLVKSSGPVPKEWRYDETTLDKLLIKFAQTNSSLTPAARQAIIDTRSGAALNAVSTLPGQGRRILADAWFAARSLPAGISPWLYIRVLLHLGTRQLLARPLGLIADYAVLSLACSLGLGVFIFVTRRVSTLLTASRVFNSLAPALFFGVQMGLGAVAARMIAERLNILPSGWRILAAVGAGGLIMCGAFANFHLLFYQLPLDSPLLVPGALLFSVGFALTGIFQRTTVRIGLIGAGVFLAIVLTWAVSLETGDSPLLFFEADTTVTAAMPLALLVALIIALVSQSQLLWRKAPPGLKQARNKVFTKNSVQ
jgi:hypothetical protein